MSDDKIQINQSDFHEMVAQLREIAVELKYSNKRTERIERVQIEQGKDIQDLKQQNAVRGVDYESNKQIKGLILKGVIGQAITGIPMLVCIIYLFASGKLG